MYVKLGINVNRICNYLKDDRVRLSITLFLILFLLLIPAGSFSKDYPVTYIKEQYKEKKSKDSKNPEIYHTWFVETDFGMKLLVLIGDDTVYRKWLREFTKEYDLFLLKVPRNDVDIFEEDMVFRININNLHPIDRKLFEEKKKKGKKGKRSRR